MPPTFTWCAATGVYSARVDSSPLSAPSYQGEFAEHASSTGSHGWMAERARMFKRYVPSVRHTMQVDFEDYVAGVGAERRRGAERARVAA